MKSLQRNWGFRRFLSTICYHTDSILLTQNHGEKMLINENMTGRIINAANLDIGLLINFGETSLKWDRITKFKNKENR